MGVDDFAVSGEAALKSWFPVYEYTIGGVRQRAKAFVGTAKPEVEIGQAVELFVNPDRIDEFYCPAEKISAFKSVYRSWSSVPLPCGDYGSDTFLKSVKLKRLKSNIEIFVLKDFCTQTKLSQILV
ncbi:MAG: hypothetical protein V8R14_03470 [Clostridia bacterium]